MLGVYIDESGTHHGSPSMAVAVVWADSEVWSAWTAAWLEAIAPIKTYHAVDCHNRAKEFSGFSRPERDNLVERALRVISQHEVYGFAYVIQKKAIIDTVYRVIGGSRKAIERLGEQHLYPSILRLALDGFWHYFSEGGTAHFATISPFAIIHEQNDFADFAAPMLRAFCKDLSGLSLTYAFAPKQAYVPLQCADILAYEAHKQIQDLSATRKSVLALGERFYWGRISDDMVESAGEFIASRLRAGRNGS